MSDIPSAFQDENESDHWISVADMMAGLMVIFLFIAISYILFGLDEIKQDKFVQAEHITQIEMLQKENERLEITLKNEIQDSENAYKQKIDELKQELEEDKTIQEIYLALEKEFKNDWSDWDAELWPDLTIRFKLPDTLFDTGEATLKPKFKEILRDFIPRYLQVLSPFQEKKDIKEQRIEEIRIEGHTSSEWDDAENEMDAYFENMALSQSRTRAVLEYSLTLEGVQEKYDWARQLLTANGLSSSRLIKQNGKENSELSRRVEFKIRTKVKQEILKTLEEL